MLSFSKLSLLASLLCASLACIWSFFPQFLLELWQTSSQQSGAESVLSLRLASSYATVSFIFWFARNLHHIETQRAIALAYTLGCLLLALTGVYSVSQHSAGYKLLVTAIIEIIIALTFAQFYWATRPPKS